MALLVMLLANGIDDAALEEGLRENGLDVIVAPPSGPITLESRQITCQCGMKSALIIDPSYSADVALLLQKIIIDEAYKGPVIFLYPPAFPVPFNVHVVGGERTLAKILAEVAAGQHQAATH